MAEKENKEIKINIAKKTKNWYNICNKTKENKTPWERMQNMKDFWKEPEEKKINKKKIIIATIIAIIITILVNKLALPTDILNLLFNKS